MVDYFSGPKIEKTNKDKEILNVIIELKLIGLTVLQN